MPTLTKLKPVFLALNFSVARTKPADLSSYSDDNFVREEIKIERVNFLFERSHLSTFVTEELLL